MSSLTPSDDTATNAVVLPPPPPTVKVPITNITPAPTISPSTSPPDKPSESTPPPPVGPEASPGNGLPKGTLAGIVVGIGIGAIVVLLAVAVVYYFRRRRRRRIHRPEMDSGLEAPPRPLEPKDGILQHWQQSPLQLADNKITLLSKPTPPATSSTSSSLGYEKTLPPPSPGMSVGFSQSTFTFEELAMATNGFSNINLLGEGGFGYVHKGVLPNGKVVAIKHLKAGSGQGEREFQAEVEVISRVHHRHLVSLVGYCISGSQRMLVYEFVSNNTLEFHLHGKDRPTMDWRTRMKIALGSAKGLAYLHEDCHPKIIHRDIKAANILLDNNFEAKVADFGLAKISLDTDTHVSTRVMGSFGYLAPEYASSGKLTAKSDVFSFGVVLLELITGYHPVDRTQSFTDDGMVEWARPLLSQSLESGNFDALVDPKLQSDYETSEMFQIISCAAACVRYSARLRPRMSQIVRALEGNLSLEDLNEGSQTGNSSAYSSYESTNYDNSQYKEDMKKFRKLALQTEEQGTSEYSGVSSSEYGGVHPSASSSDCQSQTTQDVKHRPPGL